jgi:hypothetical protein
MNKNTKLIIEKCLNDKIEELRLIVKTEMKNLSITQLETFNNMISDLEYAKTELKGDK